MSTHRHAPPDPPSTTIDADEIVSIDRSQTPDRWRYTCPYGHTDWDRTNCHAWCPTCRQMNESGLDVDPEHYQILDKKREVMIPWEQLELK
ncbi:hypothetical protein DJ84_18265 [Halorubrum ezzemoulense]|nr:hypothetical protein DJ84_18265 [Halorubrum ezzemoulense]